jgi:hypothetical protein
MDLFNLTGSDPARNLYYVKEKFEGKQEITCKDILLALLDLVVLIIAAKLSWECSGNYPVALRVLFSVLAGIFGYIYIILYIIFRSDKCVAK